MSRVTPHPEGGANIFLRMHKTKGPLFTWVDDWLYERLLAREKKYDMKIFATGRSERIDTVTDGWRDKIHRVFALAGPFECGQPTPHIFRHTFVRLLLQRGVSPRDVCGPDRRHRRDGSEALRALGARAPGETDEHSPGKAVIRSQAEAGGDSRQSLKQGRVSRARFDRWTYVGARRLGGATRLPAFRRPSRRSQSHVAGPGRVCRSQASLRLFILEG
jgi:hypothetical protein